VQPAAWNSNDSTGSSFNQLFNGLGLSEEMYEDGFQHITNIDISFTVVKQMTEMYKDRYPTLVYKQMDVRQLQY